METKQGHMWVLATVHSMLHNIFDRLHPLLGKSITPRVMRYASAVPHDQVPHEILEENTVLLGPIMTQYPGYTILSKCLHEKNCTVCDRFSVMQGIFEQWLEQAISPNA